ncbi:MAG: GldG family protein [Myxococcales bacterium]|nr:GldG family protein [Myxococcales bacterium]
MATTDKSKSAVPHTSLQARKKRVSASNAVLYAVFVVGAVVLVNLISTRFFARADLTEAKAYTISDASRKLVKDLPDYLNVKVFISNDLPPELKAAGRYLRDTVDEYANASPKFKWEAIDPGGDEKLQQEASACKVDPLQIQVLREGKFEMGNYYLGVCLQYADQTESIPQVARPEGLEYQLTSLVKRMTQRKRKIAFTTGHGEADTSQGLQALKEELEKEYDLSTVNPSQAEIGNDVDLLVVGGPKQAFDEQGLAAIDKFLMRGKGAIFLVDGMAMTSPQAQGMQGMNMGQIRMGQPNNHGMEKLLEAYGFKVNQDFIFEPEANTPGPVNMNGRMALMNAPVFVVAEIDEHPNLSVVSNMRGAVLPYPSSLQLVGPLKDAKQGSAAEGIKVGDGTLWRISGSTAEAWRHTGFFVLTPTTNFEPSTERGPFDFGYAYAGTLKSAFPDAAAPLSAPASGDAPSAPVSQQAKTRLVVMADSDFTHDEYVGLARHPLLQAYATGAALMFNAISWAIEDETLTPLRNKTLTPRPIQVDPAKATALLWANVVGLPFAFCMLGFVRWGVRRSRRAAMKL